MKTNRINKTISRSVLGLAVTAASAALLASASAQTIVIDPTTNNGSFESNAGKVSTGFDAGTNVPFWMNTGTTYVDSGIDTGAGATNNFTASQGTEVSYLRSSDSGAFQNTGRVIALGDVFTLSLDALISYSNVNTNTSTLTFSLLTFDPTATGTGPALFALGTVVASNTVNSTATVARSFGFRSAAYQTGILTYTAQAADVGRTIGVAFDGSSPANDTNVYTAVDNVNLTVSAVPEPSTWVMMAGGLGALVLVQSRRRRV